MKSFGIGVEYHSHPSGHNYTDGMVNDVSKKMPYSIRLIYLGTKY